MEIEVRRGGIVGMKTAALLAATSKALCVGLLVLAGVLSNGQPGRAQIQEACPLPDGLTPLADPPVTARQVEDGSAALHEFALAVRDRHRALSRDIPTFEGEAYFGCLIRQDGSPYRSGSTFLVSLAADRVLVHSKDMALSGKKLHPTIYGSILRALGARKFTDLLAGANSDGGSFDVPDIPGASGHATVYMSPGLGIPVVLLAGFDLDSSHLVSETADDFVPAVTARDVVDRETLKAFVTEAGRYLLELARTGGRNAIWRAKDAMRDPNGPWRHGSVYFYVLDLTSNLIMFHGAFPNRYELLPLRPIARDVVTGELVLPQVIEAAKSSPEGGFLEYHFDDPTDATDSADIPKVGYARVFAGSFLEPGGRFSQGEFIVGSGFYRSAPKADALDRNEVIASVLPQVMRAMTASTVDAVSSRIERANSDTAPAAALSFGGAATLSEALRANARALGNETFDFGRLLANSSFAMTLNAAGSTGGGLFDNLTLWGSGDYRGISGGNPQSVGYDGSVIGANLGIDARLGADTLAGLAMSRARGTVDYTASNAEGELTASLTSVNPYVGWRTAGGVNLWAMAGYGAGEVELEDDSAGTQSSDLTQRTVAAGASGPLVSSDELIGGGATTLSLKAEAALASADIDGSGTIESMSLSASRQRLMLEGTHVRKLDTGATFTPSLELGLRNDGGDGETGAGIEAGGALRYADEASGLTVEGRVRILLSHGGDYEETGVSGLVRIAPGRSGHGFALVVQPAWGHAGSRVNRLWENGVAAGVSSDNRARLNAEIGYGLGGALGMGAVTPYTGLGLAGDGARSWRMGARWQLSAHGSVSLDGTRYRAANDDDPEHGLMLRGHLNW